MPSIAEDQVDTVPSAASESASVAAISARGETSSSRDRRWGITLLQLVILATLCLVFAYLDYRPLFPGHLWANVAYGRWILEHAQLPVQDPFTPLCVGMTISTDSWLSQVIIAGAGRYGGLAGYGHLHAIVMLLTSIILLRVFILRASGVGVATVALALVWAATWQSSSVIRPEIFGNLCLAVLLWIVAKAGRDPATDGAVITNDASAFCSKPWSLVAIPVLFAVWANMHASFLVGIVFLACNAVGIGLDIFFSCGSWTDVLNNRTFRRSVVLTELALLGGLINPVGADLLLQVTVLARTANLQDLPEWFPLQTYSPQAVPMAGFLVLTLLLWRHSRRRIAASDVLLLGVFALMTCVHVRNITWFAPVAMFTLVPHLTDVVQQWCDRGTLRSFRNRFESLGRRSFRLTLISGLIVWLTFVFTPISRPILGGKQRTTEEIVSRSSPIGATRFLNSQGFQGMIVTSEIWGDWMTVHGPTALQPMMTTIASSVVPQQAWKDFLSISHGHTGLDDRLDRYRINLILVDKQRQPGLLKAIDRLSGWETRYEDRMSVLVVREGFPARGQDVREEPLTQVELTP